MDRSDLELYTTKELIAELMRRKTFLGIIVHSKDELKEAQWHGERIFQVHLNSNLDTATARGILTAVAEYMVDHTEG